MEVGQFVFFKFGDRKSNTAFYRAQVLAVSPTNKVLIQLPHPRTGELIQKWVRPNRLEKSKPQVVTAT